MDNFVHLHVHTEFSLLDGLGKVPRYPQKAKELEQTAIAITDHGGIDGCIKFQKACAKEGIKPILGTEFYVVEDVEHKERQNYHIIALAKNQTGWNNLCKMISFANLHGFYYKPRIDFKTLLQHHEGLVILSGCVATPLKDDAGVKLFEQLDKLMPEDSLYFEIMPHDLPVQESVNRAVIQIAKRLNRPLVATNDCHYVDKEESKDHEVLLAMQTKKTMSDPYRMTFGTDGFHIKSRKEMEKAFKLNHDYISMEDVKNSLDNTVIIAELCNFTVPKREISLPNALDNHDISHSMAIMDICAQGFRKKVKDVSIFNIKDPVARKYFKRLRMEHKVITGKGFGDYFLLVEDFVRSCLDKGIKIGPGRGSAGGSLMAYLMDITDIDPIKYKLIFERFLNPERADYPDIDLDIEDSRREEGREYLEQKYGSDSVASISTFVKLNAKGIIKDLARTFQVALQEAEAFTKVIEDGDDALKNALENTEEGKKFAAKYPDIVRLALKFEGTTKTVSKHAAAVVVSDNNLLESGQGAMVVRNSIRTINWDMEDAEYNGLVKLDLLGLSQLSVIRKAEELINKNLPEDQQLNIRYLEPNDKAVLQDITNGHTAGIFQINTNLMTKFVKDIGMDSFQTVADTLALVRPGPLDSGMADEYIKRKHGAEWEKKHPIYEEITKDTYGVVAYQEQIMRCFVQLAGLTFSTADKIRKIIGKKRDVNEFKPFLDAFIEGCKEQNTFNEVEAREFWTALEAHANYSFNLSHSVEYAMISYVTAWVKHYYPAEFLCANMTVGQTSKKEEIIKEAYRLGFDVLLPKIGISHATEWKYQDKKLFAPFMEIKGIGESKAEALAEMVNKNDEDKGPQRVVGFFNIKKVTGKGSKKEPKYVQLVREIGGFDPEAEPEESFQQYFDFPISNKLSVMAPNLIKLYQNPNTHDPNDLMACNVEPDKKVMRPYKKLTNLFAQCSGCSLKEVSQRFPFKAGKVNVAVVSEYPGYDEKDSGEPYIGKEAGRIKRELAKHKIKMENLFLTYVCKCSPVGTGIKIAEGNVDACRPMLHEELKALQPAIVLAVGNRALYFFEKQKASGILGKAGSVVWNEEYKCWVVYVMSPGSLSQNEDMVPAFESAIEVFADKVRLLGYRKMVKTVEESS